MKTISLAKNYGGSELCMHKIENNMFTSINERLVNAFTFPDGSRVELSYDEYDLCPKPIDGFYFNQQLFKERRIMSTKTEKQTVSFVETLRAQHAKLEAQVTKQKELQNTAEESVEKAEIKSCTANAALDAARLKSTAYSIKIKSLKNEQHIVIDTLNKLHRTI